MFAAFETFDFTWLSGMENLVSLSMPLSGPSFSSSIKWRKYSLLSERGHPKCQIKIYLEAAYDSACSMEIT